MSMVEEVGEGNGGIRGKKNQEGEMTKGGRRDGEHEVDRTIGLPVTFELALHTKTRM